MTTEQTMDLLSTNIFHKHLIKLSVEEKGEHNLEL